MRILVDTNIVLDVLLERKLWVDEASSVWRASDEGRIVGYITATTLTNIFYIARRLAGHEVASRAVSTCLEAFEVCPVDRKALSTALEIGGPDFEDDLQIACAFIANLDGVVTRDKGGFKRATVPVFLPSELLVWIAGSDSASEDQ